MGRQTAFPTTLIGAVKYFDDEAVCRDFLAGLRWADGVRCVFCDADTVGRVERKTDRRGAPLAEPRVLWRCKACRKEFSVTKGTIFEDSPIPLSKWLPAMWLLTAGKKSRSSHQLAKDLGVTQRTAWFMAHRIRLAMETDSYNTPLTGEVEVDETIMGGSDRNKHAHLRRWQGRGSLPGKVAVMGLLERHGEVRAKMVASRHKPVLQREVRANVEPGATVYTDSFLSYRGLDVDYIHEFIDHSESYVEGRVHTNGLENFWSLFKRVIYGTHHSVEPVHMDRYLAEATRKFNTRKQSDDMRFTDTVRRVVDRRVTWRELTGKPDSKGASA
jgi:transposase-like protein